MLRIKPLWALLLLCACSEANSTDCPNYQGTWKLSLETDQGTLMSVAVRENGDAYAVGGQPEMGRIYQNTADSWQELTIPDGPLLNWVHADGDTLWVAGNGGRIFRGQNGSFTAVATATTAPLWGIWGQGDTVFAVGGDVRRGPAVILQLQNNRFEQIPLPNIDRPSRSLFKVWGHASNKVYAVGHRGLILTYDGQNWRQVASGTGEDLISLWGRNQDELIVVGGRSNGVVARLQRDSFQAQTIGGTPGLNGVVMDSCGQALIGGNRGTVAEIADQNTTLLDLGVRSPQVIHAVSQGAGRAFAVGGSLHLPAPYSGVIYSLQRN